MIHLAAALGLFIAIVIAGFLFAAFIAYLWGRLIDDEREDQLDPPQDTETVRVLPRIDFDLNEEPGDE